MISYTYFITYCWKDDTNLVLWGDFHLKTTEHHSSPGWIAGVREKLAKEQGVKAIITNIFLINHEYLPA